jgi:AcrR family transcriptional regulator
MSSRVASPVAEIRSRDADRTQQEILAAATGEFAAHGFGGARIETIAERAGVNKKLIYYYFEGKDELFLAVLERSYAQIRDAERALHLEATDPLQAIESLVAFTWNHYLAHPEFLALLNSENMHRAGHLKQSHRIRQLNSPLIEVLAQVLARGERSGALRPGIDPMQLYISVAGLAYFYLSNKHTLGAIFGLDLMADSALAERLDHITAVVTSYVRARPEPRR